MSRKDIHVVPHGDRWATRTEGADRVGGVFPSKGAAVAAGRGQARREQVELVIHGRDGKIQDSDSYGRDPIPPRDKKH